MTSFVFFRRLLVVLCVFLLGGTSLGLAQDYRARVQGYVADASGGIMPGAELVLLNKATGVSSTRLSGEAGQFLFDFVEPGNYSLSCEMPGFRRFLRDDLQVQVRGDVTVNVVLEVGEVTETVTVTGKTVEVQFNTSTMDLTIDQKMLKDLPVVARNPFTLALLDAAVVNRYGGGMMGSTHARNPFFMWSSSQIDVGGGTSTKNDLQLDGAPLQLGPKGSYAPPMDAVQEFTVQQNSVDAESGHSAGGILSVAMKSGTNDFHGTAYYFGRNPALNAVSRADVRSRNEVRNHIWGGTLGNPIVKDKLFTFTTFEQWRTKAPYATTMTMPTQLERKGDFSQSKTQFGDLRTIYDPWSTQFDSATGKVTRQAFANNVIPDNRIDPVSRKIMDLVWLPNNPGDDITGVNNFKAGYFWWLNYWNFSNRSDWHISEDWKMFGRISRFRTDLSQPNYTPNNSIAARDDNSGVMNSWNAAFDSTYTFNPNTLLNLRFSYSSLNDDYFSPNSVYGEQGMNQLWSNAWFKSYLGEIPQVYFPQIGITGKATLGRCCYWYQHPESYNYSGRLAKNVGRHYLKFGGESRMHRGESQRPAFLQFNFAPAMTANTFLSPDTRRSGDPWAAFLLGAIDSSSRAETVPMQRVRYDFYALFLQDDFKLNRNVTLNLGLRWEYGTGPGDPENRLSRYLDLNNPIPEMQSQPPAIPAEVKALMDRPYQFNGAWIFTDEKNSRGWNSSMTTFLPRLGIAYRLDDRTALRIGYARYVVPPIYSMDAIGSARYPGFSGRSDVAPSLEGIPGGRLADPFPAGSNPLIPILGKSLGRYTNLGGPAAWDFQDLKTQTNDRFNFSIQRQVKDIVFDLTYFMNIGSNLPYAQDLNLINPDLVYTHKAALDKRVANPFFRYLTPQQFPGQLRNQATVRIRDLLVPYPHYGRLQQLNTAGPRNRYHALQFMAKRAFANGYSFHLAYNYNRERTELFFNDIDEFAGHFSWLGSNNPRHRIASTGTYELPFGHGKRFMSGAHPIVNGILGGWSSSALFMMRSGNYLRFGSMLAEAGSPRLSDRSKGKWFETSLFKPLPAFTPRTNPWQYDDLTGPREWNLDLTVAKYFSLTESTRLEVRIEAYNVTNSFMPADPNLAVTSSLFGKSTAQANRGREFQYTMRIHF